MSIDRLPISLQKYLFRNYFSFKEVKEMRCTDKRINAFIESVLASLCNEVFVENKPYSRVTIYRLNTFLHDYYDCLHRVKIRRISHSFFRSECEAVELLLDVVRLPAYAEDPEISLDKWRARCSTPPKDWDEDLMRKTFEGRYRAYSKVMDYLGRESISIKLRSDAVKSAANYNFPSMVRHLLLSGPISTTSRADALWFAVLFHFPESVIQDLTSGPLEKRDREALLSQISRSQHPALPPALAAQLLANEPISLKTRVKSWFSIS